MSSLPDPLDLVEREVELLLRQRRFGPEWEAGYCAALFDVRDALARLRAERWEPEDFDPDVIYGPPEP